jgi:POT family proton-dependent oligopeptide transporter
MAADPKAAAPGKVGYPPGIPFIIGNEAAERFSFYGMRAILVIFMTQYLRDRSGAPAPMSENEAGQWYHVFISSNYFFPIFGAILADTVWGKYRTIFWLSIVYCFGHLALSLDDTRLGLAMGLTLIAVGAGGIKPCVSANVGDQFTAANRHLVSKAFGWFYFSINSGSSVAIAVIPILLQHYGSKAAFAVPGILMGVATIIFFLGRKRYVHIPPRGWESIKATLRDGGLRTLGRLSVVYVFVAVFFSLWDQSGGEWVLQAAKMDLHIAGFTLLPSQMGVVNAVMTLAFIPIFQYLVYPLISTVFPLPPLRKIGLGLVVTGSSFLVSAWIETKLASGGHPSIAWQLPAYALLTAGEVMVSITALEFAYTQAPRSMKAIVMAFYLLSVSAGNAFTALVHHVIQRSDGTVALEGAPYYLFFAGLAGAAAVVFAFAVSGYVEVTHLQDEGASAGP